VIDGKTQLVGLIGWPVAHSLSPLMHNAAFDAVGLNWRYVPLPVPPDRLEASVRGLAALGFSGANVTVPHKQAAIPLLDSVAPDASYPQWRSDDQWSQHRSHRLCNIAAAKRLRP